MTDLMTAAERREAYYENHHGFGQGEHPHYWDYVAPMGDLVKTALEHVEGLFGLEPTAAPLLQLMEPTIQISGSSARTWRVAVENNTLVLADSLPIARRLDLALQYGLYGIVPEDIPLGERAEWLTKLVAEVLDFSASASDIVFIRIANLAASRHAIDTGAGEIDAHSMSVLGGISEGRVRNLLSASDNGLERGPNGGVVAMSAAAWLQKKMGFLPSIWQQKDVANENEEVGPAMPSDRMIFVPVARDGSMFTPDLQRNGAYRIGAKGNEEDIPDFASALERLNAMPVPRWRRPNEKGLWGIVSGVSWQRIEKK